MRSQNSKETVFKVQGVWVLRVHMSLYMLEFLSKSHLEVVI